MKAQAVSLNVNGMLKIDITTSFSVKTRKTSQRVLINEMIKAGEMEELERYIRSLNGQRTRSINKHAYIKQSGDWIVDELARKEPGSVLRTFMHQFNTKSSKRPTDVDLGQWIGVEVECLIPPSKKIKSVEDLQEHMQNLRLRGISIKHDSSINDDSLDGGFGAELTVLCKRNDRSNLASALKALNDLGAFVNKSCGLHVHLDMRHLIQKGKNNPFSRTTTIGKRLGNALPALALMVSASRRDNHFCRLGVSKIKGGRYYAINKTALTKFGTIEVRLHQSTTDYDKISNWIDILFACSESRKLSKPVADMADLIQKIQAPDSLAQYMNARAASFNRSAPTLFAEAA